MWGGFNRPWPWGRLPRRIDWADFRNGVNKRIDADPTLTPRQKRDLKNEARRILISQRASARRRRLRRGRGPGSIASRVARNELRRRAHGYIRSQMEEERRKQAKEEMEGDEEEEKKDEDEE